MYPRLPPSVTRLVFLFVLTAPLRSLATPATVAEAALVANPTSPTQLKPRSPQPSRRMGQRRAAKAETLKKDYSSFLCPGGSVACPIFSHETTPASIASLEGGLNSLADWFKTGFECIELATELNSCGGCLALGAGYVPCSFPDDTDILSRQDCSSIANARATGCEAGSCTVYSCFDGYVVSPDRLTCVKKGSATPATPVTAINVDQTVLGDEVR